MEDKKGAEGGYCLLVSESFAVPGRVKGEGNYERGLIHQRPRRSVQSHEEECAVASREWVYDP
jgi:hypothetical protein